MDTLVVREKLRRHENQTLASWFTGSGEIDCERRGSETARLSDMRSLKVFGVREPLYDLREKNRHPSSERCCDRGGQFYRCRSRLAGAPNLFPKTSDSFKPSPSVLSTVPSEHSTSVCLFEDVDQL
jgi:hypothetical protein